MTAPHPGVDLLPDQPLADGRHDENGTIIDTVPSNNPTSPSDAPWLNISGVSLAGIIIAGFIAVGLAMVARLWYVRRRRGKAARLGGEATARQSVDNSSLGHKITVDASGQEMCMSQDRRPPHDGAGGDQIEHIDIVIQPRNSGTTSNLTSLLGRSMSCRPPIEFNPPLAPDVHDIIFPPSLTPPRGFSRILADVLLPGIPAIVEHAPTSTSPSHSDSEFHYPPHSNQEYADNPYRCCLDQPHPSEDTFTYTISATPYSIATDASSTGKRTLGAYDDAFEQWAMESTGTGMSRHSIPLGRSGTSPSSLYPPSIHEPCSPGVSHLVVPYRTTRSPSPQHESGDYFGAAAESSSHQNMLYPRPIRTSFPSNAPVVPLWGLRRSQTLSHPSTFNPIRTSHRHLERSTPSVITSDSRPNKPTRSISFDVLSGMDASSHNADDRLGNLMLEITTTRPEGNGNRNATDQHPVHSIKESIPEG
ncbi:hypothetical protein DFS34DRAFT_650382 [Phlyctochytrium arcticum]|nr:hypothetical protein DFS34DRAFT_650382 [Phlyctochytrium arcticum]